MARSLLALAFAVIALPACGGATTTITVATTTVATTTAPAHHGLVPSRTAALRATIHDVNREHENLGLKRRFVQSSQAWHVSCVPLTSKLYRCDWKASVFGGPHHTDQFATWSGRSKVRFYALTSDVTLYQIKCSGFGCGA